MIHTKLSKTKKTLATSFIYSLLKDEGEFTPDTDYSLNNPLNNHKDPLYSGKIVIYIPENNKDRKKVFNKLTAFLKGKDGLIPETNQSDFKICIPYENVVAYEKSKANKKPKKTQNPKKPKQPMKSKNDFSPLFELIRLHAILAAEHKNGHPENQIILILPDVDEVGALKKVLDFYQYDYQQSNYELKSYKDLKGVIVTNNPEVQIKSDKDNVVPNFTPTDKNRFARDLVSSILIVHWELFRQKLPVVIPNEPFNPNATRSTRFTFPLGNLRKEDLYKRYDEVGAFAEQMMDVYGVDVLQDVDKNTFFVNGPTDVDHAANKTEQIKRERKSSRHAVSELLIANGFVHYSPNMTPEERVCSFHLNLQGYSPKFINLVYGTKEEKIAVAQKIYNLLKENKYKLEPLKEDATVVRFVVKNVRNNSHPLNTELVDGKFFSRSQENQKMNRVVFQVQYQGTRENKKAHRVALSGGKPRKQLKVLEEMLVFLTKLDYKPERLGEKMVIALGNDPHYNPALESNNDANTGLTFQDVIKLLKIPSYDSKKPNIIGYLNQKIVGSEYRLLCILGKVEKLQLLAVSNLVKETLEQNDFFVNKPDPNAVGFHFRKKTQDEINAGKKIEPPAAEEDDGKLVLRNLPEPPTQGRTFSRINLSNKPTTQRSLPNRDQFFEAVFNSVLTELPYRPLAQDQIVDFLKQVCPDKLGSDLNVGLVTEILIKEIKVMKRLEFPPGSGIWYISMDEFNSFTSRVQAGIKTPVSTEEPVSQEK